MEKIKVVQPPPKRISRDGQLQDYHPSAGTEHPEHFGEPEVLVLEVPDTEGAGDPVERAVIETERLPIPGFNGNPVRNSRLFRLVPDEGEHSFGNVNPYDLRALCGGLCG